MENVRSLPAILSRGIVPLLDNDFRIVVGRPVSLKAIEEAERNYGGFVLILVQKNQETENPTDKDYYEYGALAKVSMKIKLSSNEGYKIRFNIIKRIKVENSIQTDPFFLVNYTEQEPIYSNTEEEKVFFNLILNEIQSNINIVDSQDDVLKNFPVLEFSNPNSEKVANIVSGKLKIDEQSKYKYLSTLNLNTRLKYIIEDLARQKMVEEIERKINDEVKKNIDESQKEYYLREKMRAIQNELGDKAKKEEEIEELREKIKQAKMPKLIEEKALNELNRYQSTSSMMAESQVIKTYLDFLVALPWKKASKDSNDLTKVKEKLDQNHYALDKVKERIIEYLAVKIMTKRNPQTILCLYGPPGVGKTSLVTSIAEALGRKFVKQSLGGVKDESEIRGHRRTYVGAMPGRILNGMKQAGTINPVFLLDEIDKMASDYKGDPASAMLEVLDPEQNAKFSDHYLEESYDLSQVLFITTANYLENVPAPLRDRMELVELSSYTEHEKAEIAKLHLVPKQLKNHGIDNKQFTITDETIYFLIRHYTREAGVRELNRVIGALIRKAIKQILMKEKTKVDITPENVTDYLGKPKFTHNIKDETQQIGVATGLAYTAFGGDTLPVEVTYYKGKGSLVLTGKLGEVMKESALTALSFIKAHAIEYNIDPSLFNENDFHVHVPEGAVPKDGPSAGITMATAIMSAVSKKYVRKDLGMTGEITLRGYVLPIGGLKEKSIAAHRSGLKTILIPHENVRDIEDIPMEVRSELEIIPVETVKDVFKHAIV